jgi:hypothetical protein
MDKAQQSLGARDVGEAHLAVIGGQFELVTICHQLTSLLFQTLSELVPVLSGRLVVRLLRQHLDDVNDREQPCFGLVVVQTADFAFLEDHRQEFHRAALSIRRHFQSV